MAYTIGQLAALAGVSVRALRHYDQIGLLRPRRSGENGYRLYGAEEVNRLQQILFYRTLGVGLEQIKALLDAPDFDRMTALESHLAALCDRRRQLDRLIGTAEQTLSQLKGECVMNDAQKFEGFKQALVDENERRHGAEVRERYGDAAADEANARLMGLTPEQYAQWRGLEQQVLTALGEALPTGDPESPAARRACELHRRWLGYCAPNVDAAYQRTLGQVYATDERFAAYYDAVAPGAAQFFCAALECYCADQA